MTGLACALSRRARAPSRRYLEPVREPEFELEAAAPVNWDDIETADLTRANLQRAVMTDVRVFHPERAAAVAPEHIPKIPCLHESDHELDAPSGAIGAERSDGRDPRPAEAKGV